METLLLNDNEEQLQKAAELIRNGSLVGLPTETVYGLGADASNEEAVRAIFAAKGRPADNPLIVHLADFFDISWCVDSEKCPHLAYQLAEHFWPGPLTMVLPKSDNIPYVTSGGLDTVGIRVPAHPVMRRIIKLAQCPIAAPSANTSGYPSPTTAEHVMRDMNGKIAAVVDGGQCEVGVESTVISFDDEKTVRILRPGAITPEMLRQVCDSVIVDPAILSEVAAGEKVASPGMKYKHYSPIADIIMVESTLEEFTDIVSRNYGSGVYALLRDGEGSGFPFRHFTYGADSSQQAHLLFQRLRELDDIGAKKVYVRAPSTEGVGLAVYNRLIRAAGFEVIRV